MSLQKLKLKTSEIRDYNIADNELWQTETVR